MVENETDKDGAVQDGDPFPIGSDIEDRKKWLASKLDGLSREDCILVAGRAALRVLPVWPNGNVKLVLDEISEAALRLVILPLLRCQFVASIASIVPPQQRNEFRLAAALAANSVYVASREGSQTLANLVTHVAVNTLDVVFEESDIKASKHTIDIIDRVVYTLAQATSGGESYIEAANSAVSAFEFDVNYLKFGSNSALALEPIWPITRLDNAGQGRNGLGISIRHNIPQYFRREWVRFEDSLNKAGDDWDVWVEWYNGVIYGRRGAKYIFGLPTDRALKLWQDVALIDDVIWKAGPVTLNAEFKRLIEEARREADLTASPSIKDDKNDDEQSTIAAPELPNQLPGRQWGYDSEQQKITLVQSGEITDPQERSDFFALLPNVRQCVRELQAAIQRCRSNSIRALIEPRVDAYANALSAEPASIVELYAAGIRLRNIYERTRKDANEEGLKDFDADIGEPFDSVLGLHGLLILSTKEGNILYDRANKDQMTKERELQYKEKAREFAQRVQSQTFIDDKSKTVLADDSEEVGTGPHPERATDLSLISVRNLLVQLSQVASGIVREIAIKGVLASSAGLKAVAISASVTDGVIAFLVNNAEFLMSLAATCGEPLAWFPHMIVWLLAQQRSKN